MPLHVTLRHLHRSKAKLGVQSMRIARYQDPPSQALEPGMVDDRLHHPCTQATPPIRIQHEHIAKIGEGREIADHPREPNLGCPTSGLTCRRWELGSTFIINPK